LPIRLHLVDVYEGEALFIVRSESDYFRWYEVFINQHGQTTCDCMDSIFRRKTPHFVDLIKGNNDHACKHMQAIAKQYNEYHINGGSNHS
jgi:hypothetical protein